MKKVLKMFKKWLLNVLDSFVKFITNTDSLTKVLFVIPTLLVVGTTPLHAVPASAVTATNPGMIPHFLAVIFLFFAFLFSIVVAYAGMGYVGKRKISSFIALMLFVVIYLTATILYLVTTAKNQGVLDSPVGSAVRAAFTKSIIINIIAIISTVAGSVFAALKIDPTYYKERNN